MLAIINKVRSNEKIRNFIILVNILNGKDVKALACPYFFFSLKWELAVTTEYLKHDNIKSSLF